MTIIRKILGSIIIFIDAVTRPKPMKRSQEAQSEADFRAEQLSLYQFHTCPFCVKVRRAIHKLNINVKLCDAKLDQFGKELLEKGGKRKVPCLKIDHNGTIEWMYESKTIIEYLQRSFNPNYQTANSA